MQFTVRAPRWLATMSAIVVAAVVVAALLPATASSEGSIIKVCIDPTTMDLTVNPTCTGSVLSWNQQGVAGVTGATGATGVAGAAGATGAAGPAAHLGTSKPTLTAKIEAALQVQNATITDVNHDVRASLALTNKLLPSSDPTIAGLQAGLKVQGTSIGRLVNVLRALTKAQNQLLQGLE